MGGERIHESSLSFVSTHLSFLQCSSSFPLSYFVALLHSIPRFKKSNLSNILVRQGLLASSLQELNHQNLSNKLKITWRVLGRMEKWSYLSCVSLLPRLLNFVGFPYLFMSFAVHANKNLQSDSSQWWWWELIISLWNFPLCLEINFPFITILYKIHGIADFFVICKIWWSGLL